MAYGLLNSLATELDSMLTDLCSTPPPVPFQDEPAGPCDYQQQYRVFGSDTATTVIEKCPVAEQQQSDECSDGSTSSGLPAPPCLLSLEERLLRTQAIWLLRGIQRKGATHLLQNKEPGNFIVRESSKDQTMAISVRLPPDKTPVVEHYLVELEDGRWHLETSENKYDELVTLVAHYCTCCDELPVQLQLPTSLRDEESSQSLASLALLGQDFWTSRFAIPRPTSLNLKEDASLSSFNCQSQSSLSSCVPENKHYNTSQSSVGSNSVQDIPSPLLVSYTPLDEKHCDLARVFPPMRPTDAKEAPRIVNGVRPTPPNTLNLNQNLCSATTHSPTVGSPSWISVKSVKSPIPPAPPPRWSKPSFSQPSTTSTNSFTVTTTLTFSVNNQGDKSTPSTEISQLDVLPKNRQMDSEVHLGTPTNGNLVMERLQVQMASAPSTPADECARGIHRTSHRRPRSRSGNQEKKNRRSYHYHHADIIRDHYYSSSVADKVSDYEDIWNSPPRELPPKKNSQPELTTFKPRGSPENKSDSDVFKKSPDSSLEPGDKGFSSSGHGSMKSTSTSGSITRDSPLEEKKQAPRTPLSPLTAANASPFYAEPADALRSPLAVRPPNWCVLRDKSPDVVSIPSYRYSDSNIRWPPSRMTVGLERIDSAEEVTHFSSSVDNLAAEMRCRSSARRLRRAANRSKPVKPPRVEKDISWPVDSDWEFLQHTHNNNNDGAVADVESELEEDDEDVDDDQKENRFPLAESVVDVVTMQDVIAQKLPGLQLVQQQFNSRSESHISRMSEYDNLGENNNSRPEEDTLTEYSEPWDNPRLEQVLTAATLETSYDAESAINVSGPPLLSDDETTSQQSSLRVSRKKSFKERMDPLMSPPRLHALRTNRALRDANSSIRSYVLSLSEDKETVFARNIDNFICCTREGRETNPHVVMRNVRQFMSGMKNYLVKSGEREFEVTVERERAKLRPDEFLNLDSILETVLQSLVIRPLRSHIYRLFVDEYTRSGDIQLLADNISYAKTKSSEEFGLKPEYTPPSGPALEVIKHFLTKLQDVCLPLDKLENLLGATSAIYSSSNRSYTAMGADDFLPMFVYVLVQCELVSAEIEAEYMLGLLHPSLLSGEWGYYLTLLSSAVHVLKSFRKCCEDQESKLNGESDSCLSLNRISELPSILKILIPDEMHGTIITKTLPVRPNMTTREVSKMVAHKLKITNPQDFGLFKLIDGEEIQLADNDCPQSVRLQVSSCNGASHCMFAYKRVECKIAWPRTSV